MRLQSEFPIILNRTYLLQLYIQVLHTFLKFSLRQQKQ